MDYKELFDKDSIEKQVTIKSDDGLVNITNNELDGEMFELYEGICENDELVFGSCLAAELKFTVSANIPLNGKWLNVDTELRNEAVFADAYRLGRYKVNSDKPTADRTSREIIAYDVLYDILSADVADWYNSILTESDSAVRMKEFRDSFFNHFGIEQEAITLVNDEMWVERTIEPSELSGARVINCICEINGCFGHINRSGKFEYVYLEPISDPCDITKSLYITATYEEYIVQPIDKLQIRQEEGDIGVIVGDGNNSYIIEDNFLVYGKSTGNLSDIANNILSKIKGLSYRPFSVECKGNPCISVGSAVRVVSTYENIESYVLTRTLKGVQSLTDTYEAAGKEYRTSKVNNIQKQIIQLKGKSNVLDRKIEETKLTISDVEQGLKNEITQTASEFDVKIQSLQSEIDGQIEVINGHGQPTLYNYPAYNWTAGPKVGDTFIEGLCFTYSDAVYKKHLRTLYFDEDTLTTYRFITKDGLWIWEPLANTEFSVLQKQITDLSVTAQGITANVEALSTKVTNEYITEVDAKSLISLTADGIKEDISKTYVTNNTIKGYSTTEEMELAIEKSAEGINETISKTYVTNDTIKGYSTTKQMNTAIEKSAEGIKSTVASSVTKWDTTDYWHEINYVGYGTPHEAGYGDINTYRGKTYLNNNTGYVYYCCNDDGSYEDWFIDYKCKTTVIEKMSSQVEQYANKLGWLIKDGTDMASMSLTPKLYELITDNITLKGNHIELDGDTTIGIGFTLSCDVLDGGEISGQILNSCIINGGAASFGENKVVINEYGMWVLGYGGVESPDFKVDDKGFVHLGSKLKMGPAGIWWTTNAGATLFKAWSSFFGV